MWNPGIYVIMELLCEGGEEMEKVRLTQYAKTAG